jgi:hypothetical protein
VIVRYAGIFNNELPKYSASCLCGLEIGISITFGGLCRVVE